MERKYYLRGFGLGIVMTAIIMGVALSGNKVMTDEEIIARAKELGMVEGNTVLSDMEDENAEEDADDDAADAQNADGQQNPVESETTLPANDDMVTPEDENMEADDAGESDVSDVGADVTVDAEDDEPEDITDAIDNEEPGLQQRQVHEDNEPENTNAIITSAAIKTITVSSGDGSYTVAKKLADVGVVTSAETFDTFLCQNGYDKRLRTGTYSIPADASDEQIARIVTGAE